jgi:carbon storage regulator CsrA
MLVLDRKVKEGFWIDGGIFVKVLDIGRRRVKLGIEAPEGMRIMRDELAPRTGPEENDQDPRENGSRNNVRSMRRREQ